jgi:hypothetical protein
MARFRIDDMVVDTANATASYECTPSHRWNGNNHICGHTGSQWEHQTLYRSRRGRYYIVFSSAWQGTLDRAEWVSKETAARWLSLNEADIPAELQEAADEVTE